MKQVVYLNSPTPEMIDKMISYLKTSGQEPPVFYTSTSTSISEKNKSRFYGEVSFANPGSLPVLTKDLHVTFTPSSCTYDSIVPVIRASDMSLPAELVAFIRRLLCSSSFIFDNELECLYLAGFVCVLFPEGNTIIQSKHQDMVVHGIPPDGACLVEVTPQIITIDNLQWNGRRWLEKGWFSRPTPRPIQQTRPELCHTVHPSWTRSGLLRMKGTFPVDDLFLAVLGIKRDSFNRVVDIVKGNGGDPRKEMGLTKGSDGWTVDMPTFSRFLSISHTLLHGW